MIDNLPIIFSTSSHFFNEDWFADLSDVELWKNVKIIFSGLYLFNRYNPKIIFRLYFRYFRFVFLCMVYEHSVFISCLYNILYSSKKVFCVIEKLSVWGSRRECEEPFCDIIYYLVAFDLISCTSIEYNKGAFPLFLPFWSSSTISTWHFP